MLGSLRAPAGRRWRQLLLPARAGRELRPTAVVSALACLAPLVAALALAFHAGGYFLTSWGTAEIVLLGLVALAASASVGWGGRAGVVALTAWAGLAAWQGLSMLWAHEPSSATATMSRTVLYAGAFALPLLGLRRVGELRRLADAALVVCAVVAGAAVGARLLPGLVAGDHEARLSTPITYWNGLGALLAFGAVLAVGAAGHPHRRLAVRSASAALVPLFTLGILFTLSRGATVVLAAGLVVLLALAPGRLETALALAATAATSIPLIVYANATGRLVSLGEPLPPHAAAGRHVALALLLAAAGAGLLSAVAARLVASIPARRRRFAGSAVATVALAVVVALVVAHPPASAPWTWTQRQLDSFKRYDPGARASANTVAQRLAVAAGTGRWQMWTVAAREFASDPVAGTGAGDYRFWWSRDRPIPLMVENAHSLYLEVLAESGLVGLALLLLPGLAGAWSVGTALRREAPAAVRRDLAVAAAACATIALHLAGDWDWQLPAVTLPAVALGGGALKAATLTAGSSRRMPGVGRWPLAGCCLLAILLVAGPVASARRVSEARDEAAGGRLQRALALARAGERLDPQSPDPYVLAGDLLTDLGRPGASDRAFAAALARSPRDWSILADWAAALLRRGDRAAARAVVARALALNPREPALGYLAEAARLPGWVTRRQ